MPKTSVGGGRVYFKYLYICKLFLYVFLFYIFKIEKKYILQFWFCLYIVGRQTQVYSCSACTLLVYKHRYIHVLPVHCWSTNTGIFMFCLYIVGLQTQVYSCSACTLLVYKHRYIHILSVHCWSTNTGIFIFYLYIVGLQTCIFMFYLYIVGLQTQIYSCSTCTLLVYRHRYIHVLPVHCWSTDTGIFMFYLYIISLQTQVYSCSFYTLLVYKHTVRYISHHRSIFNVYHMAHCCAYKSKTSFVW